jgi:hypothetical protein
MANFSNVNGQGNTIIQIFIENTDSKKTNVTPEECAECKSRKEKEMKSFFRKIVHFLESIHLLTWLIHSIPWVLLSLLPFVISVTTGFPHYPILQAFVIYSF